MNLHSVPLPYVNDASRYYSALHKLPCPVWLDSAGLGRYDILTALPHHTVQMDVHDQRDPFDCLRDELGAKREILEGVPFYGGAIGYWGYELLTKPFSRTRNDVGERQIPLMFLGIYDWALIIDHHAQQTRLVSSMRYPETQGLLQKVKELLLHPDIQVSTEFRVTGRALSNFTRDTYRQAFDQVQKYLIEGDCYQINLAQKFEAQASGDGLSAYLHLRQISPAPYSAFLNFTNLQILSASPELFLGVEHGKVVSVPIKGTRPRHEDISRDIQLAKDLSSHPKDRAENLMIVDLIRNDLGKHCATGSVRVPKLFEVKSYANVHHLVSTIEGLLDKENNVHDLMRGSFPGGSVTGAPKQRAMEIIDQLEPDRRGVYCGSIGYLGFDGNMVLNIAIRTMVYWNGKIQCWAGGGIVADSQWESEFQESLDKADAMLQVMEKFRVADN